MAVASTVTVNFTAETAKFENGIKRSRKQASQFGKAISAGFRAAGVATAALVGSLSLLTQQSFRLVDAQQKTATRLGLTQRALAGLTLAAEQTGNSQRNLELALQRSTRRIAEAAQGTGEAKKALEELGVSAAALSNLSPDEQFLALAQAFEKVENQSDRVRLGFKLFDSEGVGLINTLALGTERLTEFQEQANALGLGLERQQTKAIEEANDAVGLLGSAFRGVGNLIAAQLAPAVTIAAQRITEIVQRVAEAIPRFSAWARAILGVRAELSALSLNDLRAELGELNERYREQTEELLKAQSGLRNFSEELKNATGAELNRFDFIKEINDDIAQTQKRINEVNKAIRDLQTTAAEPAGIDFAAIEGTDGATAGGATTSSNDFGGFARDIGAGVRDQIEASRQQWEEWRNEAVAALEATRTPSEALQERLFQIRRSLEENPFIDEDLAARQAQAAIDVYVSEIERASEATQEATGQINQFAVQAARNIQDAFADFFFDPFDDGLKGLAKSFGNTLRRLVAQLLSSQLLTFLGGAFGGAFGGLLSGGLAVGGRPPIGRATPVGERGPEMFAPGSTGSIRPLGSVTINQSNDFSGSSGVDAATLIPILEESNRQLKAEIIDEFDRGTFV